MKLIARPRRPPVRPPARSSRLASPRPAASPSSAAPAAAEQRIAAIQPAGDDHEPGDEHERDHRDDADQDRLGEVVGRSGRPRRGERRRRRARARRRLDGGAPARWQRTGRRGSRAVRPAARRSRGRPASAASNPATFDAQGVLERDVVADPVGVAPDEAHQRVLPVRADEEVDRRDALVVREAEPLGRRSGSGRRARAAA